MGGINGNLNFVQPSLAFREISRANGYTHCRGKLITSAALAVCLLFMPAGTAVNAFGQISEMEYVPDTGSMMTPNVVRWSGTLPEAPGRTVTIQFDIFENRAGGPSI